MIFDRTNKFNLSRILASGCFSALALLSAPVVGAREYSPRSVMMSGSWVKIGVEESGVYEISYATLREMGFSDPSKVGVFGRGGSMLPLTFTDDDGNFLYDDDLKQVAVRHFDNKIYFYASGVDNISFTKSEDWETFGGHFANNGRNIYSDRGYYFLSDAKAPLMMSDAPAVAGSDRLTSGVGYVYHEKDLEQNNSNTGQLFWGEKFNGGESSYKTWDVVLPGVLKGERGVLNTAFVSSRGIPNSSLRYGIVGGKESVRLNIQDKPTIYFHYQSPEYGDVTMTGEKAQVFVDFTCGDNTDGIANLDYWILTYPKSIPTLRLSDGSTIAQDCISFPSLGRGKSGTVELSSCHTFEVWNITDVKNPTRVAINMTGSKGTFGVKRDEGVPSYVVFDTSRSQKQISGYEKGYEAVANQNLHSFAEEGAELAIITIESLRDGAEKLAQLHRERDGINVVVATAEELYNEFSGGMPDPMAYRSFARMLYTSPGQTLKNILLIGPLYGDFRGLSVPKDASKGLIAFQTPKVNYEKGAMNANDVHGVMANIGENDLVEKMTMDIGVGILPCYFPSELYNYVEKVKSFLDDDSNAYRINSTLAIGGIENNHLHDNQAMDAGDLLNRHNFNSSVNSKLIINAYGNEGARLKLFEYFNYGKNFVIYFGHGGPTLLGPNRDFFTGSNVLQFRNTQLPFMAFAGCLLSNVDRGQRGIGESIVLDTKHGAIGTLVATRDTWSGQNKELMTHVMNSLYRTKPATITSDRHETPLTIGEIIARAKSTGSFENELAYQLICDPAIVIPVVGRRMNISLSGVKVIPGQKVELKGTVLGYDEKTVDKTYNGEVVVRLMEPAVTLVSQDFVVTEETTIEVEYSDRQIAMSVGEVRDGEFTVSMVIPEAVSRWSGERVYFNFSAYDSSKKIGAATTKSTLVQKKDKDSAVSADVVAPAIEEMYFDSETCCLVVSASDDVALESYQSSSALRSGFVVYLDNRMLKRGSDVQPLISPDGGVNRYVVSLDGLAYGKHTARCVVSDINGNTAEREITFMYSPYTGKYNLEMDRAAVVDEVVFRAVGSLPGRAVVYLVDKNGKEVYSAPLTDGEMRWNRRDYEGNRLPAGLYKAFLRENDAYIVNGYSEAITVPLL